MLQRPKISSYDYSYFLVLTFTYIRTSIRGLLLSPVIQLCVTFISTSTHRRNNIITRDGKHVHFISRPTIATYHKHDKTTMLTYDSGTDGHYLSKKDRNNLGLPVLRVPAKKAGVANGSSCNGKYVTTLPLTQLYNRAAEVDTFEEFPTSIMSVGKTADYGNMSIFTKDGVIVYKEEDVLITCQRNPILIVKRDKCGRYRIPLNQDHGKW